MDRGSIGRFPPEPDPRLGAIQGIVRLAQEDWRRGVRYWFDPDLAEALRCLVREVGSSLPGRPIPTSLRLERPIDAAKPPASPIREPLQPEPTPDLPRGHLRASTIWASDHAPRTATRNRPGGHAGSSSTASAGGSGAGGFGGSASGGKGARPTWGPAPEATGRSEDWKAQLERVDAEAQACTACALCRTRRHVVFGTGSARVPLVFVGEAPGADEDAQGIPFVGRAGQLLTRIIEAIGLKREDVYICNILKCRPPENRNPAPEEIERCSPFLARQLALLRPKVICTLGLFASQTLLQTNAPIGKLRGRLLEYQGIKVLPTYHPAALLRNPNLKAVVWEDVQLLRQVLDE